MKASKYLPGGRAGQGRDQPQLSGSTQRPEWELQPSPGLARFSTRRLGEPESPAPCPTPSGQLSGPLQDSGGGADRGDAERWRLALHVQGAPHVKGHLLLDCHSRIGGGPQGRGGMGRRC